MQCDDMSVQCSAVLVQCNAVSVQCNAVSVQCNAVSVRCNAVPVQCNAVMVCQCSVMQCQYSVITVSVQCKCPKLLRKPYSCTVTNSPSFRQNFVCDNEALFPMVTPSQGKKARRERKLLKERQLRTHMSSPPLYARRGSPTYEPYEPEGRRQRCVCVGSCKHCMLVSFSFPILIQ